MSPQDTCTVGHLPACLRPGEPAIITARSVAGLTHIGLRVVDEYSVELPINSGRHKKIDGIHNWTWITADIPHLGRYIYTFTSDTVQASGSFCTERGAPRTQYPRTYVLLPQDAGAAWAAAVLDATWNDHRYTVGSSADDAGIGNLDARTIIAVNPDRWPGDLYEFYQEHYPGITFQPLVAETPDVLCLLLSAAPPSPLPPQHTDLQVGLHDATGGEWMHDVGMRGVCLAHCAVQQRPAVLDFTSLVQAGIRVLVRIGYGYADGSGTIPPLHLGGWTGIRDAWVQAVVTTINNARGVWGWIIGNEINNPCEWPGGYPHPDCRVTPSYYSELYNQIYRAVSGSVRLSPAALDPYNVVAQEFNRPGDPAEWAEYIYNDVLGMDFVALHAKTQSNDPAECWSEARFTDAPLTGRYLHLRTVEDQLRWIPEQYRGLPVYVTELNPQYRRRSPTGPTEIGWLPDNAEWVRQAHAYLATQPIAGAMFYRYENAGDQAPFGLANKPVILQAIADLLQ